MSFLQKLRAAAERFMQGRYGPDQLSVALLALALVLNLFVAIFGRVPWVGFIFRLLSWVALILSLYRIFSRQKARRGTENRRFLTWLYPKRTKLVQGWMRFRNRKNYVYFSCPNCKCKMRLPKSVHGTVKITCKSCGQAFEKKL